MKIIQRLTRRDFLKGAAATGVFACLKSLAVSKKALANENSSRVFKVDRCPIHDGQLRHQGLDVLLELLAAHGVNFYQTNVVHPWGGTTGIISRNDVVLVKVNCQWKCRGTTNTDVLRGSG